MDCFYGISFRKIFIVIGAENLSHKGAMILKARMTFFLSHVMIFKSGGVKKFMGGRRYFYLYARVITANIAKRLHNERDKLIL